MLPAALALRRVELLGIVVLLAAFWVVITWGRAVRLGTGWRGSWVARLAATLRLGAGLAGGGKAVVTVGRGQRPWRVK